MRICFGIIAVLALAQFPGIASAQYFRPQLNPYSRPALSPYLDLVRGGNPAINYYLGTLPEIDRRGLAAQQLATQQQLPGQPQPVSLEQEDFIPALSQTGHAAGFQTYGYYFSFPNAPRSFLPLPSSGRRR